MIMMIMPALFSFDLLAGNTPTSRTTHSPASRYPSSARTRRYFGPLLLGAESPLFLSDRSNSASNPERFDSSSGNSHPGYTSYCSFSQRAAMPIPVPMHMEVMPNFPFVRLNCGSKVATCRAPVQPSGCLGTCGERSPQAGHSTMVVSGVVCSS